MSTYVKLFDRQFTLDENCYPRILYFKTRLRRIFPRMLNILKCEGHLLRSDEDMLERIRLEIEKDIRVGCISMKRKLLSQISVDELVINPSRSAKTSRSVQETNASPEIDVIIIVSSIQNLAHTLEDIEPGSCNQHQLLVVINEGNNDLCTEDFMFKRAKDRGFDVVIVNSVKHRSYCLESLACQQSHSCHGDVTHRSSIPQKAHSSGRTHSPKRPQSPMHVSTFLTADIVSKPKMPSPPNNATYRTRFSSTIDSPPCASSGSPSESSSSLVTPDMNPTGFVFGERNDDAVEHKRRRPRSLDTGSNTFERSPKRTETMDKEGLASNVQWDTEELKKKVQYLLEQKTTYVIIKMLELLKKSRRDTDNESSNVSSLDKLIYEVEGLLSQSVTESGDQMKRQIEEQRISQQLKHELLSVDGVYGCGTIYARLNIHIEESSGNNKSTIEEKIKQIVANHNYKETDYVVKTLASRPSVHGQLLVCSS